MSDGCDFDPNWWKARKAISLKRKKSNAQARRFGKAGDTFLIVTEGTVTEPVYFEFLLKDLQLYAVRVVKVMPGRASDPRHVIETAADEVEQLRLRARKRALAENEVRKFDHVWAVIDTDVAERMDYWKDVRQLAAARRVTLAHSTPCFEYWLLLHLQDTTRGDLVDGTAAKRAVRETLGQDYSTNEQTVRDAMPLFIPHWPEAVRHAGRVRQYHIDAVTPDPANPSTDVDRLVRALNDSAPEHSRKPLA